MEDIVCELDGCPFVCPRCSSNDVDIKFVEHGTEKLICNDCGFGSLYPETIYNEYS
jgi:Zn ribbon nucleic-acid-binding protein